MQQILHMVCVLKSADAAMSSELLSAVQPQSPICIQERISLHVQSAVVGNFLS